MKESAETKSTYRVPLLVFRFLISLLIEGRAIMCIKSYLPSFSIGKQREAHIHKMNVRKRSDTQRMRETERNREIEKQEENREIERQEENREKERQRYY